MKTSPLYPALALAALLGGGATYQSTFAAPRAAQTSQVGEFTPSKPAPLSLTVATDKTQYKRGETVTFIISIRNVSAKPQQLSFPNGQEYDVTAGQGRLASAAWQWSWGASRLFVAQQHTMKLAPGAIRTWRATWNQRLLEGQPQLAPSGKHRAIAKVTLQEPIQSNVVDLNIVP